MRIAFDLDDTLIPGAIPFPLEPIPLNPLRRIFCSERLRLGTIQLINRLWRAGHEVGIYTTSFRGIAYTKLLFRGYRTRVGKVINVPVHRKKIAELGTEYATCSKFPPMFQIDLLIDNCGGVLRESERYPFQMLHIDPSDTNWVTRICDCVGL